MAITTTNKGSGNGLQVGKVSDLTLVANLKPGGAEHIRKLFAQDVEPVSVGAGIIDTIHTARVVIFDNDNRMMMITEFDGTWEQYMEDFATKMGPLLDAVFAYAEGYPGAADFEGFKRFHFDNQITPVAFYVANADATVKDVGKAMRLKNAFDQVLDVVQS